MSKWIITDGAAGRLCIIPAGLFLGNRLAYGGMIHKEVECRGLLEAMKELHLFEKEVIENVSAG